MRLALETIGNVTDAQLCCGCGACAALQPKRISMIDDLDQGRRPLVRGEGDEAKALEVCPGFTQRHDSLKDPSLDAELSRTWGPVIEVWEGHAADPEIRFAASSGGAATALSLYAIERGGMHGVIHTAARGDVPYLNQTVMSTSREQLLAATGSRYAPASPCEGLTWLDDAPGACVFVGKPCDVLGAALVGRAREATERKIGLRIGFFCAGTPTTRGTLEMLRRMGIDDPSMVRALRYRGQGWPGQAKATIEVDGRLEVKTLTYSESWGEVLSRHKQWRCNLCPDRTGEFADISVGDPWYEGVPDDAPGRSLILVRTVRGKRILESAVREGYLAAEQTERWKLRASQPGFPELRGAIWGRLLALRLIGLPVPRVEGFSLLRHWLVELTLTARLKSLLGTIRRAHRRGLRRSRPLQILQAEAAVDPIVPVTMHD